MANFRAGKNSRAYVNNAQLTMADYSSSWRGGDLDTTNFEDNGFETGQIGPNALDWSLSGVWNAGQNPLDDPPGLYPRNDGSNMYLYTNLVDNKFFLMPVFRCITSSVKASATGNVTFDSSGKSQGTFSTPTGSV